MNVELSPTEMALVAAALNQKVRELDEAQAHIDSERERLGGLGIDVEVDTTGVLIRSMYANLVRRLEQRLDVPFMDSDEARAMLIGDGVVVVAVG